ncbi:RNA-guided endonuclease InsQ/TnpB family protein [Actinomadura rudentiformis]|uniref:Transposase n=1 Tax=Actinomadura rudentiformis TaxID=359158 RepID=A0A6H9YAR8_9ACTN|nr:RNA-guided endonuclease TnpB family protein [Actinomadura rudentiformis]KAB2342381.1 transposase [Actinomadura rudentiformis]
MRRSFKFLLRPTGRQAGSLAAMLADHGTLYNAALQERRGAYAHCSQTRVRYGDQSAQLKEIRAFDPDGQGRWSFSSQQATLRRLNRAFEAFFRRVKAGDKPGYPRFRSRSRFDTVEFPKDGDGCRWDSVPHDRVTRVRLQGVGHVRVHQHRPIQGRVKTISIKREGCRWYVIVSCDDVPARSLPVTGRDIGIDLGVTRFLTASDGEHVPNPRHLRTAEDDLAAAQRALDVFPRRCRARDRSKTHRAAVRRVVRLHAKIRRQRLDHAHKTALHLVRSADRIAHEQLAITNMTRRPAPRPDGHGGYEPNGAAAKAGLNRSILDAGWGVFLGILTHKAECAGRELIPVIPANTSRTCPSCGHVAKENRDRERFACTACGHTGHADHVAALNIATRAGLALRAAA